MIIGSNRLFYDKLPSTNTLAASLLNNEDIEEGTVIHTNFQTAGRGQKNNIWESEKSKNLLFSVILYPDKVLPAEQFYISMAVSIGICDFIDRYFPGSKIKWPNDIYINDDKIAGILIENSIRGEIIESTITGIGFNINQEEFAVTTPKPVSLKILTGKEFDTLTCLDQMLSDLDERYKQLLYGDRELIRSGYIKRLYRFNEWHEFRASGAIFRGKITNISSYGNLMLMMEDGLISEFSFKEIEYLI